MDKLSYRVPFPARIRFAISEEITKLPADDLLIVINAVMKTLQSSDEIMDVNMLSFELRQKFEQNFEYSLVKMATKFLSNEGYIKLQWMDAIKASDERFGNHKIVICHATARFNLGPKDEYGRRQIRQDFKRKLSFGWFIPLRFWILDGPFQGHHIPGRTLYWPNGETWNTDILINCINLLYKFQSNYKTPFFGQGVRCL